MRNPLSKRVPRELKKNLLRYLGMILILVCTICAGTSFQSALNGAMKYLSDIKETNIQEDGFFETSEQISEEIVNYFKEDGIRVYDNFYATDNEFDGSVKLLLFDERTDIDLPTVFEGSLPQNPDEIAFDHVFASTNGFEIGDTVNILGKNYKLVGTVSLPDYTALFMNNTDLVMNTHGFGVSVLNSEGFEEIDAKDKTYRYSFRFDERDLKTSVKNDKAKEMQQYLFGNGYVINTFLTNSQNQSISFLEMDINTDGPFITVFVYILVGLIAFIFAVLTNNTIEKESVIIGTLRALGYKKSEIMWHYLQPTLIVAVIGSVLGNILGYTVLIKPFLDLYYTSYSIGPLEIEFNLPMFLLTTVLPVAIMVLINLIMMGRKLSLSPLKFLRRELTKKKSKKNIKLPNLSFLNRFRLRIIIQNLGSYIMLFMGIFLASFLLMFGIGLNPLIDHYTAKVGDALPFSYEFFLKAPVEAANCEKVYAYEFDTWFFLGQKDIAVSAFGIDDDGMFFKDAYVKDGIKISSAAAGKLNLKEGDIFKLKDSNTDKEYEFEVKGIYEYDSALAIFIERETLTEILEIDKNSYNCLLSDEKLDIDSNYIAKQVSRDDIVGAIDQMMDSFDGVIVIINVFSIVVYIIMIYILTRVVIDKNALSISYMKVFGYRPGEIRKLYLTTTTIVVFASLVLCIPIEIELFKLTLVFLSALIEGYMSFYLPVYVYIEIIAIGIVAYFAINSVNIHSVKKIPMTDALKNRE